MPLNIFLILWFLYTNGMTSSSFVDEGSLLFIEKKINISASSICNDAKHSQHGLFPYDQPEFHLPWVWDVVADSMLRYVEFIAVSRSACSFNHTAWHRVLGLFPQYSKQLGDGADENILVPIIGDFDFVGVHKKHQGILGKTLTCVYYDNDEHVLSEVRSFPVLGDPYFSSIGTLSLRCPFPSQSVLLWHRVSVRRPPLEEPALASFRAKLDQPPVFIANETEAFRVCYLPTYKQPPRLRQFRLSVCTATMENRREHLVEWIEFHRLIGVQHFFIYDTAQISTAASLTQLLTDYIQEGLVTVIVWPYSNCVRRMASGDWILWFDKGEKQQYGFQPPRAIAQSAALASCYSRFRSTSRYMLHIDEDEFLSIIPQHRRSRSGVYNGSIDLARMADKYFQRHPAIPALSFAPIHMHRCPHLDVATPLENRSWSTRLPRVHAWKHGFLSDRSIHNGKLLMRTEAVGGFFVHYITMLEDFSRNERYPDRRRWNRLPFRVPVKFAAILHYKVPAHVSGSIYGQVLPMRNSENASCRAATRLMSYQESLARGGPELKSKSDYDFEHLALPDSVTNLLLQRFQNRMMQ